MKKILEAHIVYTAEGLRMYVATPDEQDPQGFLAYAKNFANTRAPSEYLMQRTIEAGSLLVETEVEEIFPRLLKERQYN